jgi:hypothetical protein
VNTETLSPIGVLSLALSAAGENAEYGHGADDLWRSEHNPGIGEDRIVVVRVSAGSINVRGGAIKLVVEHVLQSDAHVHPRPEGRSAIAERKVGNLGNPAGAVGAAGEGAVKRRVRSAAYREPPSGKAPCMVIDVPDYA